MVCLLVSNLCCLAFSNFRMEFFMRLRSAESSKSLLPKYASCHRAYYSKLPFTSLQATAGIKICMMPISSLSSLTWHCLYQAYGIAVACSAALTLLFLHIPSQCKLLHYQQTTNRNCYGFDNYLPCKYLQGLQAYWIDLQWQCLPKPCAVR